MRMRSVLLTLLCLLLAARGPAAATCAGLRGDGTLVVNGKGVFPVGVRSEKLDSIGPIAKAGFNLILGSGEWGEEHYRSAEEQGLLILAGHHVWLTFRGAGKGINLAAREEALLKSVLRHAKDQRGRTIHEALAAFDDRPGVIGWCISDEPEAKLHEVAEAGYEIFKSNSPSHLVAQISPDPHWFAMFRTSADVLIVDHYPFRGRGSKRDRRNVLDTHERIKRAVADMGGKPVWLMPQLYPPSYWSCLPGEELTLRDLRLASYAGLIAGAKGIVMYHWDVLPFAWTRDEKGSRTRIEVSRAVYDRRVADVAAAVRELKTLGPIVAEGRPATDISIRWVAPGVNGPGPQMSRVWDHAGRRYLATINLLDVPIEGQVFAINANVNYRAYTAEVFLGKSDVAVTPDERPGEFTFRVAPRGSGVLVLTRRPISALPPVPK